MTSIFSLHMEAAVKIEEESNLRKNAAFQKAFDAISTLTDNVEAGDEHVHGSSNYTNVKAMFHQSNNDKLTFAERLQHIEQSRIDTLYYANERNKLKKSYELRGEEEVSHLPKHISLTSSSSNITCKDDVKVETKLSHSIIMDKALQEIEEFYGLTPQADQVAHNVDVIDPDLADVLTYLDSSQQGKRKGSDKKDAELLRLRDRTDVYSDATLHSTCDIIHQKSSS